MPKVFVVNEPLKRVTGTSAYGRAIDLRPAESFGELVFLAPAGEPPLDPEGWWNTMTLRLLGFNFTTDFLLPVGHPALITAAAAILGAYNYSGKHSFLNILVWRGRELGYVWCQIPLLNLTEPEGEPLNAQ